MPAEHHGLPGVLVALDFDGTLAPLVPDPSTSRPVEGAIEALIELAQRGAQVAIITGRDARTAVRLGGLDRIPGLLVAGLYGLESWRDGRLRTVDTPAVIQRLRRSLPAVLAGADPDLWLEDKRLSLVVHARRCADPDAALTNVRPALQRLAAAKDVDLHDGHLVIELRLPDHDKGRALREVIAGSGADAVVYAGDDLGDLPAFAVVAELAATGHPAISIAVAADPDTEVARRAMRTVPRPHALLAAVRSAIAELTGPPPGPAARG